MHTLTTITSCILAYICLKFYQRYSLHVKLPPGPPRGLLGDNSDQLQGIEFYKRVDAWAKIYGSIYSFLIGGTPVIVLNTASAAWDLLEKKGDIYSSRPRSIVGNEILAQGLRGLSMPYGENWRKWRKASHHPCLSAKAVESYHVFQSLESSCLLRDLMNGAHKHDVHFSGELSSFATSVSFSISYGIRIEDVNANVVKENRDSIMAFAGTQMPGRYIVESWPILLWLPKPLQWFRRQQEIRRTKDIKLYMGLLDEVKRRMTDGLAKASMSSVMLNDQENSGLNELQIAYAAAAPFSAGIPTIVATLEVFLVIAIVHTHCVKKAQAEIDSIVGNSRSPSFSDEVSLPYVKAFIKEVLRWGAVAPCAVPHSTIADDEYNGYTIPKGSTVYGNIYAITKDPELFPDPEEFKPERFLDTTNHRLNNFDLPFGFGRRICPGIHVANHTLFIAIARILWAFDISAGKDHTGQVKVPDPNAFTGGGLTRRPVQYGCTLTPRTSEIHQVMLEEASKADEALHEWD
ncbi:cytochrome P450 [Cyathus striatus]|nr:cytochrome P450 [Cyathus striatus]